MSLPSAIPSTTALLSLLFLTAATACAQMKTGEQMKNFDAVFGVTTNRRTYDFDAILVQSSAPGNILHPGEQPELVIQVVNRSGKPISARGSLQVIAYGSRGIPGDIWLPELYRAEADPVAVLPVKADIPADGFTDLNLSLRVPDKFGAYACVLEIEGHGARFVTSLIRTFPAGAQRIQYPKMSLDHLPLPVLRRLGVQAIRHGIGYVDRSQPRRKQWLDELRAELTKLHENHITVLLMVGEGGAPQPLGRPRPHLDDKGLMLKTKSDYAWLPSVDAEFQEDIAAILTEFGWPRGPVTAISLWNEPWEGISISGWGADMLRYREIYTAMARGVESARESGVDVLLAGADSSSNTWDKFSPDGSDTFLKWLDVCTVHYQGLSAPVLHKSWRERGGPRGRVRVWDTESWVANTDDRVAAVLAGFRAAGYDRSMGIYGGNIAQPVKARRLLPEGRSIPVDTVTTWSVAAAVGAAQHFIGERDFRELLFQRGLPWIFVFDGQPGRTEDGTVVVCGDLAEAFGADRLPFHTAALQAGAQLTLPADPAFILHDFYGNVVTSSGDRITIPLDHRGFYLRTDASPGSFSRLLAALRTSQINGVGPVAPVVRDPTAPLDRGGFVRVALSNVLNHPISGSLKIEIDGLDTEYPKIITIAPHETQEIAVRVSGGSPRPDNQYRLSLVFDTGETGVVRHEEQVHVNFVARRTISIDGDLSDWTGVLPQTIRAGKDTGPTLTEQAWLPFEKYPASAKTGFATAWLAHDDDHFYFAARILDDSPDEGTLRFATRDDEPFFYPEVAYELDSERTLQKREETWDTPRRQAGALVKPDAKADERSLAMWSSTATAFALDMKLPQNRMTQLAFYFVDPDDYERGRRRTLIQVMDRASGRVLAQHRAEQYGFGAYAIFAARGDLRIVFRSQSWLPASLSGLFLDPSDEPASDSSAQAKFLRLDEQTGGKWQQAYGRDGYHVIGTPARLPTWIELSTPKEVQLKEHRWPEGVRRFTYRKRPILPSGNAPKFDNVQIAFGVRAPGEGGQEAHLPGVMPGFVTTKSTDYEYALNKVSAAYGGGTEIWRLHVPGMPRKHFYPRQPKSPFDGAVENGRLVIKHEGNTRIVEASLPWSELPLVKAAIDTGRPVRFSFRINDNQGPGMELAAKRSASAKNDQAFHADWVEHWANTLEFGFEP